MWREGCVVWREGCVVPETGELPEAPGFQYRSKDATESVSL